MPASVLPEGGQSYLTLAEADMYQAVNVKAQFQLSSQRSSEIAMVAFGNRVSVLVLCKLCGDGMHLPVHWGVLLLTRTHRPLRWCNIPAQDYHRLQSLNRKLTEFHTVLQKALKDSQGLSWNGIDSQHTCPSQASLPTPLCHSPVPCVVSIRHAAMRAHAYCSLPANPSHGYS